MSYASGKVFSSKESIAFSDPVDRVLYQDLLKLGNAWIEVGFIPIPFLIMPFYFALTTVREPSLSLQQPYSWPSHLTSVCKTSDCSACRGKARLVCHHRMCTRLERNSATLRKASVNNHVQETKVLLAPFFQNELHGRLGT